METQYNRRSPAVKRLMREAQELSVPTSHFYARPLEDNLFEWHFTVRGPSDTDFQGGIYHGRIILPTEYPMKPPNIILLTPNGRFEVGKKICLSISGHHPETWQPSWSIRTALLAIIGFMPTPGQGTIGSLEYPPEERKRLARKSASFVCPDCGSTSLLLKSEDEEDAGNAEKENREMEEIVQNVALKGEAENETASGASEGEKEKKSEEEEEEATAEQQASTPKQENFEEQSEESREKAARKKASMAAQERFKARMAARTRGLSEQLKNVQAFQASPQQRGRGQEQARQGEGLRQRGAAAGASLSDYLIVILVVGIIAILCRRLGSVVGSGSEGVLP